MSKVLVVSDVHLKLRKDVEFEQRRFLMLIDELIARKPFVIIFNGDLLDRAIPTLSEIRLLNQAFKSIITSGIRCVLLDGNHEAVNKESSTYDYLTFSDVEYIKNRVMHLNGVSLYLCSWSRLGTLRDNKADILVSHYRASMPGLYEAEIDIAEHYDNYKFGILGDIHDMYTPKDFPNFTYTSSPYSISGVQKADNLGYIELDITAGSFSYTRVPLKLPQRFKYKVRASELKDFTPQSEHQYNLVVSGTIQELNALQRFPNVTYTKIPELVQGLSTTDPTQTSSSVTVPFIDKLANHVALEVGKTTKQSTIKEVLQEIQGAV